MKIWVTGAGGMMGSHLMEMLTRQGHTVKGSFFKPTIEPEDLLVFDLNHQVDITDWCSIYDFLAQFKPDVIFHLAAQSFPTVSWERPVDTFYTNVIGTIHLFESLKRLNLKSRVIVACSSAEYGFVSEKETPVKEEQQLKPLHPYGVSKVAQDLLTYQYYQNYKIDGIRARIFNCTGPRKKNDALSDFIRRAVSLEQNTHVSELKVGNLSTYRAIVDVRDLNRALILLAEKGTSGDVYNISGNEAYPLQQIAQLVLKNCKRKDIQLKEDPALLRTTDEKIIWGDTTKLRNDTGWKQEIPIQKTIEDMFEYWRAKIKPLQIIIS